MPAIDPEALSMQGLTVESQDSALGRWTVARWTPSADSPLHGTVERIWYFDGRLTHERERVFPDGTAELIVMLDERHRDGGDPALAAFPAVCINGCRTQPSVVVSPRGRCRVLGIRFAPAGACSLLRSNMKQLVDVTIDVRDVIGRASDELGERCATAAQISPLSERRNAASVVFAAVNWLLPLARVDRDALVQWTSAKIREARGTVSLDRLGARLGVSRNEFARRFRDHTGLTPKRFARIVRFHNALSLLHRSEKIAAVAAELAYYDQAHMYRDFAEFARLTPGEFLSATRYPESPSLAEP
ncbi:MAG: helix-turn-helix domain-containing protein [Candidatus Cybelea sp.]